MLMKSASELIAHLFDEKIVSSIAIWAKLDSAWASIVENNKIAAAAAHSRMVEFEKHVLLFEADHPGWIQILQTKESELLSDFQRRFPNLAIAGISFRLSREPIVVGIEPSPVTTQSSQVNEVYPPLPANLSDEERFTLTMERLEDAIIKREERGRV